MGGPFRSDEEARRERSSEIETELGEIEERLAAARATRRGLRHRERPLLWSILSPSSIAFVLMGLAIGACVELDVDRRWIDAKCAGGAP